MSKATRAAPPPKARRPREKQVASTVVLEGTLVKTGCPSTTKRNRSPACAFWKHRSEGST